EEYRYYDLLAQLQMARAVASLEQKQYFDSAMYAARAVVNGAKFNRYVRDTMAKKLKSIISGIVKSGDSKTAADYSEFVASALTKAGISDVAKTFAQL